MNKRQQRLKILRAFNIINLYILSGGINNWLNYFPLDKEIAIKYKSNTKQSLNYRFYKAVGDFTDSSNPGKEYAEKFH